MTVLSFQCHCSPAEIAAQEASQPIKALKSNIALNEAQQLEISPWAVVSWQSAVAVCSGTIVLTLSILLVPIGSGGLVSQPAQPHGDEEDGIQAARYCNDLYIHNICDAQVYSCSTSVLFWLHGRCCQHLCM